MKFATIILAAGNSSRYPGNKLLENLNGMRIIEYTLKIYNAFQVPTFQIVLVVGSNQLNELDPDHNSNFVKVTNPKYKDADMASSILIGIEALELSSVDGVFIHPADIPLVSSDDIAGMMSKFQSHPGSIVIPQYQSQSGHPVLIPSSLLANISSLSSYQRGLRDYIDLNKSRIIYFETENAGILHDLDTSEDLKKLRHLLDSQD